MAPRVYGHVSKESKRMNTIISQLLTQTRGYEGRFKIVKESFDISIVIENVLEGIQIFSEAVALKQLHNAFFKLIYDFIYSVL